MKNFNVLNLYKIKELPSPFGKVAERSSDERGLLPSPSFKHLSHSERKHHFTLSEIMVMFPLQGRGLGRGGNLKSSEQFISPSLEFLSSLLFAKKFLSLPRRDKCVAFTLAEVLITLGIIGVVAAITLPALITNINERINSERQANIAQKITQAMEQMRAHGLLNQSYASTDAFVDELQKYLKVAKRCDSTHIADCWPTSTVIGNDEQTYTVSDTITRNKLHLKNIEGNNNVGLVLSDGASLILSYNTGTSGIDVGDIVKADSANLPVGGGKTKEFPYTSSVTGSIDFVMDVNGAKGPNKETTADKVGDIRSFKAAKFGADCPNFVTSQGTKIKGMCVVDLGTLYTWAGAMKACSDIGMSLASRSDLNTIYAHKGESGVPTNGWFWSSAEYSSNRAWAKYFGTGGEGSNLKSSQYGALCVGD